MSVVHEQIVWADEASPFTGAQVKALLDENEKLRNWVLRLSQMPLDWTSQETQRRAKEFWRKLEASEPSSEGESR